VFCVSLLAGLFVLSLSAPVRGLTWEYPPPIPDYDPERGEKIRTLWADHYSGKNLDQLVAAAGELREAHPGKIEPLLLLARAHYFHARYIRQDRQAHFEQSEKYAFQACKLDPKNIYALAILVDTLCYSRDREYIFTNYGALIRSYAPLPSAEALPDMQYAGWPTFKQLWLARVDIDKAKSALAMVEKMAQQHPDDGLAQVWAARTSYYVGEYYTGEGEHDTKSLPYYEKGMFYAAKARKLMPHSVPANYWYQINRARSVQTTNLLNKARYLMDMLVPLYFCSRENSNYYFCGPGLTLATMVTNGGWVTEKGMRIVGVTLEMVMNGLEISEILFPNYYYTPYARADILAYKGNKKEALAMLEKIMSSNPDVDPLIPENHIFIRLARHLHSEIKNGKY